MVVNKISKQPNFIGELKVKNRNDLEKVIGAFACCNECHEDHEIYGYDLSDVKLNGEIYETCCHGSQAIEEYKKKDMKE